MQSMSKPRARIFVEADQHQRRHSRLSAGVAMPICMAAIPSTSSCPGTTARIAPKFHRMISLQQKNREEIMTTTFPSQARHETLQPTGGLDRRSLLRGAAAIATTVAATSASARDFGRGTEPQRYPA